MTWVYTTKMPLRDPHGNITGTFGVSRDITERKQAEAESSRLAAIVNSSDDAIFSSARDGLITTWNAGAERMYGYLLEEIRGKHFTILIPKTKWGDFNASRERLFRGEAILQSESEHVRKDGSKLPASLTLSPIKDATGDVIGVSVIVRDITERKRAEHQLRKLSSAVEQVRPASSLQTPTAKSNTSTQNSRR